MKSLSGAHEAFGQEVRRCRTLQGWSQEEMGHRVGVHPTYIGGIERGERNVSLTNILKIATVLDVPAGDLVNAAQRG